MLTILLLTFIMLFFFIIKEIFYRGSIKVFEFFLGIIFLFFNIYYYLFMNNILLLVFLFELQSVVFIYLMSVLYMNSINIDTMRIQLKNYFNQFF